MWCWLSGGDELGFLGDPLPLPRFDGQATARSFRELFAGQPWRSTVSGFNLLGSHDTTRFRTVCDSTERQVAGAGLLFTFPGVPMVFAGDEIGLTGVDGDGARQPMPWDDARWDAEVLDAYRRLGALRRRSRALRHGGLRWVEACDDVLVFMRESQDERALVQVSRSEHQPVALDAAALDGELGEALFGTGEARRTSDTVILPATGAGVHVWELETRSKEA